MAVAEAEREGGDDEGRDFEALKATPHRAQQLRALQVWVRQAKAHFGVDEEHVRLVRAHHPQ